MSSGGNKTEAFDPFGISGDDFDPFGITASPSNNSVTSSPSQSGGKRQNSSTGGSVVSSASAILPPKIIVRLCIHEEVSSSIESDERACLASIEGVIQAQVHSSNATKNAPFLLQFTEPPSSKTDFRFNDDFAVAIPNSSVESPRERKDTSTLAKLMIPKAEIGTVEIARYTTQCEIKHMPFLAQSRIKIDDNKCRIALQVRSNLANKGELEDFTIAVAVPQQVKAGSIKVTKGDGKWDGLKRAIKWSVDNIPKGESMMIAAEADLVTSIDSVDDPLPHFPILLRCKSKLDRVSKMKIDAASADGHPAAFTVNSTCSFRLLHRVS